MALNKIRIVCVSDTHGHAPGEGYTLPKGDVLIHAGDLTNQGSYSELKKAAEWLEKADYGVKIVVAGNHDLSLDPHYTLQHPEGWTVVPERVDECRALIASIPGVTYLHHEATTITLPRPPNQPDVSLKVFGSPYSPARPQLKQNWAFQYPASEAEELWRAIPEDTDILVTHTPPQGVCESSHHWPNGGCEALTTVLGRVRPLLHVCGHCHEGRGAEVVRWSEDGGVWRWEDASLGTKKLSLLDLSGGCGGRELKVGKETAVVNCAVLAKSHGREGKKEFNKAVVVDLPLRVA